MPQNFDLASNQVLARPDANNPMTPYDTVELFSAVITGSGSEQANNSARVFVKYHAFDPDTSDLVNNTPYKFGVVAVLEQEQSDLSWEEIGRQNTPLSELSSGKEREIFVSPLSISTEEGIDTVIVGLNDVNIRLKSAWQDDASGNLRVRIIAMQGLANGDVLDPLAIAHAFVSTTVSINGSRFTV